MYFEAQPEDFKDSTELLSNITVVKSFPIPTLSNRNKTMAKTSCQKFCGSIGKCEGCIHQCVDMNCQWTAIRKIHVTNDSKVALKVETTRKPSKQNLLSLIKIVKCFPIM